MTSVLMTVSQLNMGRVWGLAQYLPLVTDLILPPVIFLTRASQDFVEFFLSLVLGS